MPSPNPCECPDDTGHDLRPVDGPDADRELAAFGKALAHPARVQIVRRLARMQGCIFGEIANELDLAQSTVSQHLKILKEAGIIRGDIDGPRMCYCIEPKILRRMKALVAML